MITLSHSLSLFDPILCSSPSLSTWSFHQSIRFLLSFLSPLSRLRNLGESAQFLLIYHLLRISAFVISLSSLSTALCIDHVALTEEIALSADIALPALIPLGASLVSLQLENMSCEDRPSSPSTLPIGLPTLLLRNSWTLCVTLTLAKAPHKPSKSRGFIMQRKQVSLPSFLQKTFTPTLPSRTIALSSEIRILWRVTADKAWVSSTFMFLTITDWREQSLSKIRCRVLHILYFWSRRKLCPLWIEIRHQ